MKKRNNRMKYLLAASLISGMALFGGSTTQVLAATYQEAEPNDVRSQATKITPGNEYIGEISDKDPSTVYSGEKDYYKYTVTEDGYFNFTFSKASMDIDDVKDGWKVSVYYDSICLYTVKVENETVTTPNFNYKKGSTLYILVEPQNTFHSYCPVNIPYKLQVNSYANSYWEQEDNDNKTNATVIKSNTKYYGNIADKDNTTVYSSEDDYYKYTVEDNGYFTLTFGKNNIDQEDTGDGWTVDIYNDSKVIYSMKVESAKVTSPKLNLRKGSNVYIKVTTSNKYHSYSTAYIDYQLQLDFIRNENWEVEDNDTKETSTVIQLGNIYYGNLMDKNESNAYSGEDDYYVYCVAETGEYTLDFGKLSINDESIEDGWEVKIYNENSLVQKMEIKASPGTSNSFRAKAGERIYVLVQAKNTFARYCPTNVDYQLRLNCIAKGEIVQDNVNNGTNTPVQGGSNAPAQNVGNGIVNPPVQVPTVSTPKAYTVQYKLNGGKNNAANIAAYYSAQGLALKNPTRKGYTFTGWYKGNTKVTKINPGTTGNITLTAKWSKVSVGKLTKLSVTAKKSKEMKISCGKVSKASGYQIIYSTNSKFKSGKTTKNIKSNNVTIKGLKKGKKYYVKVRAYKLDSSNNKVFGKYSAVKNVTIK